MRLRWLLAAFAPHAASSAACSGLKENLLTSTGCPSSCGNWPCVLFSPSLPEHCVEYGASGSCLTDDSFVVPGTTDECSVTYQCLVRITNWLAEKWFLSLVQSSLSETTVTTAAVTKIAQLTYPPMVSEVQLAGGLSRNVRGDVKNIQLDDSFFATPASVARFELSDLDLRTVLHKVNYSIVNWTSVWFVNVNLDAVPVGLGTLSLSTIDLSKNEITSINDSRPFLKANTINLADNLLTNLVIDLPDVVTLNLSGNPLAKIPDSIYRMTKLENLYMNNCKLVNLQLTEPQFTFLEQRAVFESNAVVVNCPSGFTRKLFPNGGGAVCLSEPIPPGQVMDINRKDSDSSNGTAIGATTGVGVVIAVLGFFVYHRRRRRQASDGKNGAGDALNPSTNNADRTYRAISCIESTPNHRDTHAASGAWWKDEAMVSRRLETGDLHDVGVIGGQGAHVVWLVHSRSLNQKLASKRLIEGDVEAYDSKVLALVAEAKIVSMLQYPSIVQFVGVAWSKNSKVQVLYEYMDSGDLSSFLARTETSTLPWLPKKLELAINIIEALVYTHSFNPPILHRNIRASNVFLTEELTAKLGDFGSARPASENNTMATRGIGKGCWLAPEILRGSSSYDTSSDIYSFGVLLCELDTHQIPFVEEVESGSSESALLPRVGRGDLRPRVSASCPPAIRELVESCLAFDPTMRADALQIAYKLRLQRQQSQDVQADASSSA